MAHVLLFRPIYDPEQRWAPTFPWALLYLAAPLVERGIGVDVVDEPCSSAYQTHVRQILEAKRPVAVGISAMTGHQIRYGLAFARFVRAHSDAAIVWGGIHPSLLPEQTAEHDLADYVVAGEGDEAFVELVERLAAGEAPGDVPGVFTVRAGEVRGAKRDAFVDLDVLAPLPYDLVDVDRYIQRRPELGVERLFEICTSRGCPHHCGFCYVEAVHASRWRHLEPDAVVERVKEIVDRFRLDGLQFREDNFFVSRRRVEAIAQRLIDDKVGIKWAASCRVNYFAEYSDAFVDLLRRSGCTLLTFGVESGSPRVLELIRKDITIEMVLAAAHKAHEHGIRSSYHFMAGFPSETEQDLLDTCRLIDRLLAVGPEVSVRDLAVFTPYPGVGLIPACLERGYREPDALEAWAGLDWTTPDRPWLTPAMSRRIADARFVLARMDHRHALVRTWARTRWKRILRGKPGPTRLEHAAIALSRKLRQRNG